MTLPWRGWYHCMSNTHGTWLRGDPRGWRSRHHREHVDGDYKHPPAPAPGIDKLHKQSRRAMKRGAVILTPVQRAIVCNAFGRKLTDDKVEIGALVVTAVHMHVVARFPNYKSPGMAIPGLSPKSIATRGAGAIDPAPRHYIGRAKKHSAFILRERHPAITGGVWATRGKVLPVECEEHFDYLCNEYLPGHVAREGGVLWSIEPSVSTR